MEKLQETEKDLENFLVLYDTDGLYSVGFDIYSPIYRMSNENLSKVRKKLDVKSKDVLTVCASGDQYLTFVLSKANDVEVFDINKLTEYYLILKIVAIMVLSLDDYKKFFTNDSGYFHFNEKIYAKFDSFLPDHIKKFWNTLFSERKECLLLSFNTLFYPDSFSEKEIPYLKDREYKKLSRLLEKRKLPTFYQTDLIKILDKTDKKYDLIYLSNICTYFERKFSLREWIDFLNKLTEELLKENGSIIDYRFSSGKTLRNYLSEYYTKVKSVDFMTCYIKDSIYVYRKK